MIKIAVFASGSGSNAENLYHYFAKHPDIRVGMIVSSNAEAGVCERARRLRIPLVLVSKRVWQVPEMLMFTLQKESIDFIVLAGFLWKIPSALIDAYPNRIVNIHPSLLPLHGGQGMYGMRVHRAVIAAADTQSGISIHYVNEAYDEGAIIEQIACPVNKGDDEEQLAERIHQLEYIHFPPCIERVIGEQF